MKQGDGSAASTGRGAVFGWTLGNHLNQHRTKIMIHMPVMDLFSPIFTAHFSLHILGLGTGPEDRNRTCRKSTCWDGISNFGSILVSLLFWGVSSHAPKLAVLWH